jgi:xylose isomerase
MSDYRFSFGPWNLSEGADPFGPTVRRPLSLAQKLERMRSGGFHAVMAHDDDVVPEIDQTSPAAAREAIQRWKTLLGDHGLVTELVAPRLWEDPRGAHGGFTSNDPAVRQWAIDRARRTADVGRELGTDLLVLWLAREGTYIREAKDAVAAHRWLVEAVNAILEHDPKVRIAIEPKPNEPMDHAYLPTIGHALALAAATRDPNRVGALIETAHSLLAGLDPSDDMAFALSFNKLWSVHLNDQNGLKYDQDKVFGAANLRVAFNQVRVLDEAGFAKTGMVAFDTKPMRTTRDDDVALHLIHSRRVFELLLEKVRTWDRGQERQMRENGDYEQLEMALLAHLMGAG